MQIFTEVFPSSIYPAMLILVVVFLRLKSFFKYHDYMQLGRALPELILGGIYTIDSFSPFTTIDRVTLLRNTVLLLFGVECFYQIFITPKLRRLNNVVSK
jgi:hypothetical protein